MNQAPMSAQAGLRLVATRIACAAALLLTIGVGSARPESGTTNRLRIGLRERLSVVGYGERSRGRFHLKIRGTTSTPCTTSFALRLGDLSIDVPLVRGRATRRGTTALRNLRARVATRGNRLAVDARGVRLDGVGSALAARILGDWRLAGESTMPCGLFAGEVVLDGVSVPIFVGVAGRFDVRPGALFADQEDRSSLSIVSTGFCPGDAAATPVVRWIPGRPGGTWDGRVRGAAFAVGAAPTLSYATSAGRRQGLDAWESPDVRDFGEGQSVGDGVSSLALPGGTAYMVRFDAAVQTPSGPQSLVVRAETPDGRRGRRAREIDVPDADPPLIADSNGHVLEVRSGGVLWAWGYNAFGQVGDGTYLDPVSPVPLAGPTDVRSVAAGFDFSLAVDGAGQVWIWGEWDHERSIGDGVFEIYSVAGNTPMRYPRLDGIAAVTGGMWEGGLALDDAGVVLRLGNSSLGGKPFRRERIDDLPPIAAISQATDTAIALDRAGGVWDISGAPVLVTGLPTVSAVSAGEWGANLALGGDGSVWSLTTPWSSSPVQMPLPRPAVAVSAGDGYFGALLDDGTVWTWSYYGVSEDSDTHQAGPSQVRDLVGIERMWVGRMGTALAVDRDGATWTWASDIAAEAMPTLAPRAFRPGHHPEEYATLYRLRAPRQGR